MDEQRTIWSFHGGLHLDDHKAESNQGPVRTLPLPSRLTLPLQQHIGQSAEPVVRVGDELSKQRSVPIQNI